MGNVIGVVSTQENGGQAVVQDHVHGFGDGSPCIRSLGQVQVAGVEEHIGAKVDTRLRPHVERVREQRFPDRRRGVGGSTEERGVRIVRDAYQSELRGR